MNNTDGALDFEVLLKTTDFKKEMNDLENRIRGLVKTTNTETGKMDSMFRNLAGGIGAYFTFQAASQLVSDIISVRGEFQQLNVAFETMLGSKSKADQLMAEAVDLAAKTPFTLQDVATGAKSLIAYGTGATDVTKTLKMLGDVASGVSAPLGDLVYLYGTAQTQGKVYTRDVMQFAGRGIPIYKELSKVLGVAEKDVQNYVEAGKVGFADIQKVFQNMTSEGGMFFNLMEKQSKTITGQISNLQDAWSNMLNTIGQSGEGVISSSIQAAQFLVKNYEEVLRILLTMVTTYGSYKAVLMSLAAVEKARQLMLLEEALAGKALTTWEALHAVVVKRVQMAYQALNASNPWGWLTIGIGLLAGIITYLYMYETESSKAASHMEDLAKNTTLAADKKKALAEATSQYSAQLGTEKSKLDTLFDQIRKTNVGSQERQKIIDQINSTYGTTLTNISNEKKFLSELNTAYKQVTDSILKKALANAKEQGLTKLYNDELQARSDYNNAKADLDQEAYQVWDNVQQAYTWKRREASKLTSTDLILMIGDVKRSELALNTTLAGIQKQREDLMNFAPETNQVDANVARITQNVTTVGGAISKIDAEIQRLNEEKLKLPETDTGAIDRVNAKIADLTKRKNVLEGKGKSEPMGTLEYWQDIVKKMDEAMNALPKPDNKALTEFSKNIIEAQMQISQAQDMINNLSPDDKDLYNANVDNLLRTIEQANERIQNSKKGIIKLTIDDQSAREKVNYLIDEIGTKQDEINRYNAIIIKLKADDQYSPEIARYEGKIAEVQKMIDSDKSQVIKLSVNTTNYDKALNEFKTKRYSAQKEIEQFEFNTKPFSDQLEYRKTQYQQYYNWVKYYGKQAADDQFSALIAAGSSYEDYLANQQAKLAGELEKLAKKETDLLKNNNRTTKETAELHTVQTQKEEIQRNIVQVKLKIDDTSTPEAVLARFRKELDNNIASSVTLTERLRLLKKAQNEVSTDFSIGGIQKYDEVTKQIKEVTDELLVQYSIILSETQKFENDSNQIRQQANEQRSKAVADMQNAVLTPSEVTSRLEQINRNELDQLASLGKTVEARTQYYTQILGDLSVFTREQLSSLITNTNALLSRPEYATVRNELVDVINNADKGLNEKGISGFLIWQNELQKVALKLQELGPDAEKQAKVITEALKATEQVYDIQVRVNMEGKKEVEQSLFNLVDQVHTMIMDPENLNIASESLLSSVDSIQKQITDTGVSGLDKWGSQYQEIAGQLSSMTGKASDYGAKMQELLLRIQMIRANIDNFQKENIDLSGLTIVPPNIDVTNAADQLTTAYAGIIKTATENANSVTGTFDNTLFNELITKYQSFDQKRREIESKYLAEVRVLRAGIKKDSTDQEIESINQAIQQRQQAYANELMQLEESHVQQLDEDKSYYKLYLGLGRQALNKRLKQLREQAESVRQTKGETSKEYQDLIDQIQAAEDAGLTNNLVSGLSDAAGYLQVAADLAAKFDGELSRSAKTAAELASNAAGIAQGLASGNYVQAAASALNMQMQVSDLIYNNVKNDKTKKTLMALQGGALGLINYNSKKKAEETEREKALVRQLDLQLQINEEKRNEINLDDYANQMNLSGLNAQISLLTHKMLLVKADYDKVLKELQASVGTTQGYEYLIQRKAEGKMNDQESALLDILTKLRGQTNEYQSQLEDLQKQINMTFAGTSADELGNSIINAFKEGKTALYDFGQTFDEVMKQAAWSIIQTQILMPLLQKWVEDFALDVQDKLANPNGPRVKGQRDKLEDDKKGLIAIQNQAMEYANSLSSILGVDLFGNASPNSLSGAVKGITEESASIIAGTMNATRIIQIDHLKVARDSLFSLAAIQQNTYIAAKRLESIDRKIKSPKADSRTFGG